MWKPLYCSCLALVQYQPPNPPLMGRLLPAPRVATPREEVEAAGSGSTIPSLRSLTMQEEQQLARAGQEGLLRKSRRQAVRVFGLAHTIA